MRFEVFALTMSENSIDFIFTSKFAEIPFYHNPFLFFSALFFAFKSVIINSTESAAILPISLSLVPA